MSAPAPSQPHASNAPASAEKLQSFANDLSGEGKEPGAPSIGLLQLIILIRKADLDKEDAWSGLVNDQLRHMKAAVKLISTDPLIRMKYGGTLDSAMKLVGILKARAAEKELEERIDGVVDENLVEHLPSRTVEGTSVFKARGDATKAFLKSK